MRCIKPVRIRESLVPGIRPRKGANSELSSK